MKSDENPIGVNKDGSELPCPLHYVAFQRALSSKKIKSNCWSSVKSFGEARPGDIICYSKKGRSLNRPDRGQHIMMVKRAFPKKNNIIPMIVFHTTGQRTSSSVGTGVFTEIKSFKLNEEGEATHVRWSRKGKFYKRRLCLLRLLL